MPKILIIDDDKDILEALELTFEGADFEVKISMEVDKIPELIRKFQPDVIMLDVLLSGEDGREVCKQLKANEKTKQIPVIMTSAHPDAQQPSLNAGADSFIAKPFDIFELIETVKRLIKP